MWSSDKSRMGLGWSHADSMGKSTWPERSVSVVAEKSCLVHQNGTRATLAARSALKCAEHKAQTISNHSALTY